MAKNALARQRIIAIISGKGGVGKSTTAVALAALGAARGHSVVLIDTDPMGGATYAAGFDPAQVPVGLSDVLNRRRTALEAALPAAEGYAVIPATPGLVRDEAAAPRTLPAAMTTLAKTDLIVIDTPPGFGPFAQAAAAVATDIVVPIIAEPLAVRTAEYVLGLLDALDGARDRLRGWVPTRYEGRRVLTGDQMTELLSLGAPVLTPIPNAIATAEAPIAGKSIVGYAPRSAPAIAYGKLADALRI